MKSDQKESDRGKSRKCNFKPQTTATQNAMQMCNSNENITTKNNFNNVFICPRLKWWIWGNPSSEGMARITKDDEMFKLWLRFRTNSVVDKWMLVN